ncbi:MAG: SdiA-regulated domain-containing protein [Hyphomonadaceae bacterium]|nr:SdiA-regulated domain-containing protein [Hyphomonadaceae bacterium]
MTSRPTGTTTRAAVIAKWASKLAIFAGAIALSTCNVEMKPQTEQAAAERVAEGADASLFAVRPDRRWRLPNKLREISGLAATRDGRLFGHGDENGVVYQLDIESGRITKNFALGRPVAQGDFEGIAILPNGDFYLVTSTGLLYRFREGEDGEHVSFETFDTQLAQVCEIEGLAATRDSLILACKTNYQRGMRNAVALYSWRPGAAAATPFLRADALAEMAGERVHPSGIEIDQRSGRLILVAARERLLAELNPDGTVAVARRLDESHQQAEGVTVTPDGALVIADEAAGSRALLTRYPRAH